METAKLSIGNILSKRDFKNLKNFHIMVKAKIEFRWYTLKTL
jgi:hypothetical protein